MKNHRLLFSILSLLITTSCSHPSYIPIPAPTIAKTLETIQGQVSHESSGDRLWLTIKHPQHLTTQVLDTQTIAFVRGWVRGNGMGAPIWNQGGYVAVSDPAQITLIFSGIPSGKNRVVTVQAYDSNQNLLSGMLLKGVYSSPPSGTTATVTLDWRHLPTGQLLEDMLDKGYPIDQLDATALQEKIDRMIYQEQPIGGKTYALHPGQLDTEKMATTLQQAHGNLNSLDGDSQNWKHPKATFPVVVRDTWNNPYNMGDFIVSVDDPASKPVTLASGSDQVTVSDVIPGNWNLRVHLATNPAIVTKTTVSVKKDGTANLEKGTVANPLVFPLEQVVPQLFSTQELFGDWTPLNLPHASLLGESHPSLLFNQAELPGVLSRLSRQPYQSWLAVVTALANQALGQNMADSAMGETNRSRWTRATASAYVLGNPNPAFLAAAKTGLLNMAAPNQQSSMEEWIAGGLYLGPGWGRWLEAASAYQSHAIAYDLVAGTGTLTPLEDATIRTKLAQEADAFYQHLPYMANNNWKIKLAAALGTGALTLANYPGLNDATPQQWLDRALEHLEQGLAHLKIDGSYGESPHYANYTNQNLIPFVRQYQRLTGTNLAAFPLLQKYFDWTVKIAMPNGRFPAFDDSWENSVAFQPMLADALSPSASEYRWLAESTPTLANMLGLEAEAIAYYNDTVPQIATPTFSPIQFFPSGGEAIFRSAWAPTATYGVFLGEGNTDGGHEHYEPGHFSIFAFGQNLAIDSGYGSLGYFDPSRTWYLSPEAHNVILVDGNGPTTSNTTQMINSFALPGLAASEVTSSYGGANLNRILYFVNNSYFVAFDRFNSNTSHQYDFLLHGNGTYSNPSSNQARWDTNGVMLNAFFTPLTGGNLTITPLTGKHGLESGNEVSHTYVKVPFNGQNTHMFTLLLPERVAAPLYLVSNENVVPAGQARQVQTIGQSQTFVVADGTVPVTTGNLTLQALFGMAEETGGLLTHFGLQQGNSLSYLGVSVLQSSQPIGAAFQIVPGQEMHGYLVAEGSYTLTLEPGFQPADVLFNGQSIPHTFQNGQVTLNIQGSGSLELGINVPVSQVVQTP